MKKTFKSSMVKIILCFFTVLIGLLLIAVLLAGLPVWANANTETFWFLLPIVGTIAIITAIYLAFFRWNIKVVINQHEVVLMRGMKTYMAFSFENYNFSSYMIITKGLVNGHARYLQVFPRNVEQGKIHKLHNFSRKIFEECIAYINEIQFQQSMQQELLITEDDEIIETMTAEEWLKQSVESLEKKPLVFVIDRIKYVKRTKAIFRAISIPMIVIITLLILGVIIMPITTGNQHAIDNIGISLSFVLVIAAVLVPILIIMGWLPYKRARENTPEKIIVYHDRIVVDEKTFMYRNLTHINMTTPYTTSGTIVQRRALTITEPNETTKYTLGDDTDKIYDRKRLSKNFKGKVFENYNNLFDALNNIFAFKALNQEENIFTSNLK